MNLLQIQIPELSEAVDSGDLSVRPPCVSFLRSQPAEQAICQDMVSTFMLAGLVARYHSFFSAQASKAWEHKTTMLAKTALRDSSSAPHEWLCTEL